MLPEVWIFGVLQQRDRCGVWNELAQETKPLRPDIGGQQADPGEIAARLIQAGDEAIPDRIAGGRENDRDCGRCCLGSLRWSGASRRDNNVDSALDEIGRQRSKPVVLALGRAVRDRDVLAFEITGLLEALEERCN